MKLMRTIIITLLCMLALGSVVYAAGEPLAMSYSKQNYVAVTGKAQADKAGSNAVLMLVEADSDINSLTKDNIAYIAQKKIAEDGTYNFEFAFSGLTYNENNNVDNYKAIINIDGEKFTPEITKAVYMSDMLVSFNLDFSNFGKAEATIENTYSLKDLSYELLVAFYNDNDEFLALKKYKKYTGDDSVATYSYNDVPEGTSYARSFIWESLFSLSPLSDVQQLDIKGHTENRSAMTMSISPGIDETQRNFAWYDLPGVENAKIQIAEKVKGDASDFDSATAVTFNATSGAVDASKYNGTPLNSSNPNVVFNHTGDYSWVKATVTGLENGKEYVYRVGDKFGWCKEVYDFKTDANPKDGLDFLIFADEHYGSSIIDGAADAATEKAFEVFPDADMVFALGDNVDLPWPEIGYTKYFAREHTNRVPIATIPGPTHDMLLTPAQASLFGYHFNMPNQSNIPESHKGVCGNYWFRQGDVLFIGLAHNWDTHANHEAFIKSAVEANTDAKWKILYSHLPFIPDGQEDNPESYFNGDDSDFIYENGIDVALFAHNHISYRTFPMIKGVATTTDESVKNAITNPDGVIYLTVNSLCARNYPIEKRDYMVYADNDIVQGAGDDNKDGVQNFHQLDYHTAFATASIKTTDTECSLEIKTYKNTHKAGTTFEILNTELIDEFKITKTK